MFKKVHFSSPPLIYPEHTMIISDPNTYSDLLRKIEVNFKHGAGQNWTNQDFEELSDKIFQSTGKTLSITTLKRIWGRTESKTKPSLTTLNILSEFAGYSGWRDFALINKNMDRSIAKKKSKGFFSKKSLLIGSVLLIITFLVVFQTHFLSKREATKTDDFEEGEIEFTLKKVASGYPNTVIFEYDVGNLSYDSLFLQQSWDQTKRVHLKNKKGLVTSTYYYPGYFLSKLVIDNKIIKEHELYIPTHNWQGILIDDSYEYAYLEPRNILLDSTIRLDHEVREQMIEGSVMELYLANLTKEPEIDGTNFTMESEFRMSTGAKGSICHNIRMTITGTREVLSFQFGIPGCIGDLLFYLNKEMISGRDNDLTGFGIEVGDWTNCKIRVKNKKVAVFMGGKQVYSYLLSSNIGNVGGVQWMFQGIGEIRKLEIYDAKKKMNLIK